MLQSHRLSMENLETLILLLDFVLKNRIMLSVVGVQEHQVVAKNCETPFMRNVKEHEYILWKSTAYL